VPDPRPGADDVGAADPAVAAALRAYDSGTGGSDAVLAALTVSRLLVPVVAVLDRAEQGAGHRIEKSSHLATVSTTGRDGRRGLLAFTGVESLRRWDPGARPVPAPAPGVAAAALDDGADAVVIDLAGPVLFAVEGADLQTLADHWPG